MLKTYLYVPNELNEDIEELAKLKNKSKAQVMRDALEKGIGQAKRQNGKSSTQVLTEIAELSRKYKLKGPKDSSQNMDKYLWGKDWSK